MLTKMFILATKMCMHKTISMERLKMTSFIILKRSLLHFSHSRRMLSPRVQYVSHMTPSLCDDASSRNTSTPTEVSHMEIIATVLRQPESRISKSKKKKAKDLKEDEIKELLSKAGIHCTDRRIYGAHRKLLLLEKVGCSVEKVADYPYLLDLTQDQLLFAINALKQVGFEVMPPDLILTVHKNKAQKMKQTTDDWLCDKFSFSERRELVQAVLNLTTDEFYRYGFKCKFFHSISAIPKFLKKIHILLKFGFTIEQIKNDLWLLSYSDKELQKRIKYFKSLAPGVKLKPEILRQIKTKTISDSAISEEIEENIEHQKKIDLELKEDKYMKHKLCEDNFEVVAKMLDINREHIKKFHFLEKKQRKLLVQKLQFLLDHKIPPNDIVNHIYILNTRSISKMQEVVETVKKAGILRLDITHLIDLPANEQFPRFSKKLVFHKELAMLLNVSVYDVQLFGLPDSWQADRIKMKENFDFLVEQGFNADDMKSCPLLLGHSGNTLQTYLEILKNHKEVKLFDDIQNDKHKLLNTLQYLIERDFEFCGVVTPLKKRLSHKSLH